MVSNTIPTIRNIHIITYKSIHILFYVCTYSTTISSKTDVSKPTIANHGSAMTIAYFVEYTD